MNSKDLEPFYSYFVSYRAIRKRHKLNFLIKDEIKQGERVKNIICQLRNRKKLGLFILSYS